MIKSPFVFFPIVFKYFKKSKLYPRAKKLASRVLKKTYTPSWRKIQGGPLKGREIYISTSQSWDSVIEGNYDDFFIDYLHKLNLKGKVLFDIGTHIGFNSLIFAEMVGKKGKVVAFEPNDYNRERFEYILTKNQDLASVIDIRKEAVADKSGTCEFVFTDNIEGGTSSGSFIESADTHMEKGIYEREIGFKRVNVPTISLDTLDSIGVHDIPYLIKIDVEGAEYLILEGGMNFIRKHHPILLIEIHSILNMLKVGDSLRNVNYVYKLLKEEPDGRCFIAATYQA